jgi:hypothetical protein
MKERSFTRWTVLAPTPRALAMANMPLPAVIDSGFVFPRGVDLRASELLPALNGSSARLARAAPSGGSDSPVGGLDTVPFCLARLGRSRMHHG